MDKLRIYLNKRKRKLSLYDSSGSHLPKMLETNKYLDEYIQLNSENIYLRDRGNTEDTKGKDTKDKATESKPDEVSTVNNVSTINVNESSIPDFINWCRDLGIMTKQNIKKMENHMHFYFAYGTYLSATQQLDSLELRNNWYTINKAKILETGLGGVGF
jgi:molybdenum cofactor biosynthesis enzyme MoaA